MFDTDNPIALFRSLFEQAKSTEQTDPTEFVLSTYSSERGIDARYVLLKFIDDDGFVFFTNYNSAKTQTITEHPEVAMTFLWPKMYIQIRIRGNASRIRSIRSDEYFASRDRSSQLGAWASMQSEELSPETEFLERLQKYDREFQERVPRPTHWGGYKIVPTSIEFWKGKPSRYHERLLYERAGEKWNSTPLYP